MKILAISDEEAKRYYEFYKPGCLDGFDLIISCGDLNRHYLEFLVTMGRCPVMYVPGNHDEAYREHPPEGCICLDDKVISFKGVRIMGLGGSYRYKPHARYMYTEKEMYHRVLRLIPKMLMGGVDILVTHAPALHLNDEDNLSHRGFDIFNWIIERFKPAFFLHGHVHLNYNAQRTRFTTIGETTVVNAYEFVAINLPEGKIKSKNRKK